MGSNPHPQYNDLPAQPVVMVDWQDVQDFIVRLNERAEAEVYRLPTEAEWEYACRAGTSGARHFDEGAERLGDYAWYTDNWPNERRKVVYMPVRVGLKRPNAFGLFDMLGNVWEWVQDAYDPAYYDVLESVDPEGPDLNSTPNRGIRGGGDDSAHHIRCNNRDTEQWHEAHYFNGFRLARNIE